MHSETSRNLAGSRRESSELPGKTAQLKTQIVNERPGLLAKVEESRRGAQRGDTSVAVHVTSSGSLRHIGHRAIGRTMGSRVRVGLNDEVIPCQSNKSALQQSDTNNRCKTKAHIQLRFQPG